MASRSTRNLPRNVQSTSISSSTPPALASPRKARKSFPNQGAVTRQSGNVSTLASTSSSSQSSSQASTSTQRTGGGPSAKKRTRRRLSSSDDSLIINTQNVTLSQGQSSSDSEDVVSSSRKKKTKKSTQRGDSNSGGSDTDYAPPARNTQRSQKSASVASGSSSSMLNDTRGARAAKLNTSQTFSVNGSPSKQAGALKNLINKCVFYILVADKKKYAIKKADILKNVFENHNSKENYTVVLDEANQILQKTFGLEMLTLENQKNSYIVINILDPDHGIREFAEYSEEEQQKRGLIFLLLTIIFMNENAIAEDKLWKALQPLGIHTSSAVSHPVFGNVKKYITVELVKEMYLNCTCVNKDPIQYEFTWGERAHQEVKKKDLLEFACEIMGDNKPEDWKLQFIDANPAPVNEA